MKPVAERKAKRGEHMIELKVCFWTDDRASKGKGYIEPKHGWTRGEVRLIRNDAHEIKPISSFKFNSLMEMPSAIEKILEKHGIVLHLCSHMANYVAPA